MDLFFQEFKRQVGFKKLLTYVLIAIILAGLGAWSVIGNATEDFMQAGFYKGYKGKAAIGIAAKDRNVTAGKMTVDKFQKGCNAFFKALRSNDASDVEITKDLLQYAVYADRLIMQQISLREMMGESTEGVSYIPEDAGKHFYKNEELYYRNYIDKNTHNEKEKALALSTWNKVRKPYTYYSGFKEWSEGSEYMVILSFVLMIMVVIFTSSTIAKDKENEMDEIITTTIKGRNNLTVVKIIIPWIMASIIYLCGVGAYILILKILLPGDALNTSIQVLSKTILPYNIMDLFVKLFISGLIGILTIASFSTCISSIAKRSSRAISVSILTLLGVYILGTSTNIYSPIMDLIKIILPGSTIFPYIQVTELEKFPLRTLFGKAFWIPEVSFAVNGIELLLFTLFTGLSYRRR